CGGEKVDGLAEAAGGIDGVGIEQQEILAARDESGAVDVAGQADGTRVADDAEIRVAGVDARADVLPVEVVDDQHFGGELIETGGERADTARHERIVPVTDDDDGKVDHASTS